MEPITPEQVKERREKLGLSQAQLAKVAKIALPTMQAFEQGKQKPQNRTLRKIADTLGVMEERQAQGLELIPSRAKRKKAERPPQDERKAAPPNSESSTPEFSEEAMSIRLSNIDLELINRILNMTASEKLELLRNLM